MFPAVFRPKFPVPFFQEQVPCSRLFSGKGSLFPAVFRPMFPVPGNPYQSPNDMMETVPDNIATTPKPSKEDVSANRLSRFKKDVS